MRFKSVAVSMVLVAWGTALAGANTERHSPAPGERLLTK
jgi:hypothetical protein